MDSKSFDQDVGGLRTPLSPSRSRSRSSSSSLSPSPSPSPDSVSSNITSDLLNASGRRSSPKSSKSHSAASLRLPNSGLTILRRRLFLGVEDLLPFSCCYLIFSVFLFIVTALTIIFTHYYSISCRSLYLFLYFYLLFYGALIAIDVLICVDAYFSISFHQNFYMKFFLYLRVVATILGLALVAAGMICYYTFISSSCNISMQVNVAHDDPDQVASSYNLIGCYHLIFIGSFVINVVCSFFFWNCVYGCGAMFSAQDETSWRSKLKTWFCCYRFQPNSDLSASSGIPERDVLGSIARIFHVFFQFSSSTSEIHLVPSDIIVALYLVQAQQRRRIEKGERIRFAAGDRRWDDVYIEDWYHKQYKKIQAEREKSDTSTSSSTLNPQSPTADRRTIEPYSPNAVDTLDVSIENQGYFTGPMFSHHVEEEERNPRLATDHDLESTQRLLTQSSPNEKLSSEDDITEMVSHGVQPPLQSKDWFKVREAKHFFRFAFGSYGWPLYIFDDQRHFYSCSMCGWCHNDHLERANATGSGIVCSGLCSCMCFGSSDIEEPSSDYSASNEKFHLQHPNDDSSAGSYRPGSYRAKTQYTDSLNPGKKSHSIFPFSCCHWSVRSFLLTTGIKSVDLLYAHLERPPIYYVCVDHSRQTVVIATRGTLSIEEMIIDLDAELIPLDEYGYEFGYAHRGILEHALKLRAHLFQQHIVMAFLRDNPEYSITIVGHSLGSGTAALLSLLLYPIYEKRLRCFAYSCPPILDPFTSQSPIVLDMITSISIGDDLISRLSLRSLFNLRQQMITAFQLSTERKWKVLSYAMRGKWQKINKTVDRIRSTSDNSAYPTHESTAPTLAKRKSVKQLPSPGDRNNNLVPPSSHAIDMPTEGTSPLPFHAMEYKSPTPRTSPPASNNSTTNDQQTALSVYLRPCISPGRVYHILSVEHPPAPSSWRNVFRKKPMKEYVVYPAAHETFAELMITPKMMSDHVPTLEIWKTLKLPPEYDEDEPQAEWRCC